MLNVREILVGDLQRLSHVLRYSHHPMLRRENTAEHTGYVCIYAALISLDLQSKGVTLDVGRLLIGCALHDLDETQTGDFSRDFKYSDTDMLHAMKRVTREMMHKHVQRLASGDSQNAIYEAWSESKSGDLEGAILQICDFFSVVSYLVQEKNSGNAQVNPIFIEVSSWITEYYEKYPPEIQVHIRDYVVGTLAVIQDHSGFIPPKAKSF